MHLSFTNKKNNPLTNIYFYGKEDLNTSYLITEKNITKILPEQFHERTLRLFSKDANKVKEIKQKFLKL